MHAHAGSGIVWGHASGLTEENAGVMLNKLLRPSGGNLIVTSDDGELALVKASPDGYNEIARFSALQGKQLPAASDEPVRRCFG